MLVKQKHRPPITVVVLPCTFEEKDPGENDEWRLLGSTRLAEPCSKRLDPVAQFGTSCRARQIFLEHRAQLHLILRTRLLRPPARQDPCTVASPLSFIYLDIWGLDQLFRL